jgi:multicomponent Na+:H+ antiporter subunit D
MSALIVLLIVIPLGAAGVSQALNRLPKVQRTISLLALSATVVLAAILAFAVDAHDVVAARVGGWQAPIGITLVADRLAAIMVLISAVTLLAVLVYAIGSPRTSDRAASFHPVYLVLAAGVAASFLTSDLFNLFVAFEVMLTASYVLITLGGTAAQIRHGMTYVVISLLASTLLITAIGLTYAATGTVNMADLATKIPDLDPALRGALATLFFVVFGIKAALFPLFFWLPDSYPTAPAPVTAIFAGLLTKVGVYAIVRTQTLLFGHEGPSTLILTLAALTMVIGVLGAIAQDDVKRLLSFHIISQIGYMVFGLGLFTVAGLAAAVFFIVHQIVVKTTLFLVGGLIEEATGTGQLHRLGGLVHSAPVAAVTFLVVALSLAGIPPLSGFVGKLGLVVAGFSAGVHWIVAVSLGVSLLTLFSMVKIWAGVFWGKADEPPPIPESMDASRLRFPRLMSGATVSIAAVSVGIALFAGPLYAFSERAAADLMDPVRYIGEVLGP